MMLYCAIFHRDIKEISANGITITLSMVIFISLCSVIILFLIVCDCPVESRSFPVYRGRFPVHCSSMSRSKGLNCSNDWTRLYVNIYNRPPSAWGVHILSLSMPVQSLRLFELNALLISCQYCLITWSRVLFLSLCVFIVQNISLNSS